MMTWEQKRQQSYGYLEAYKDEIPQEAYERIRQTIGSQAIEDMFLIENEVYDLVKMEKGEVAVDELIAGYINELKVS